MELEPSNGHGEAAPETAPVRDEAAEGWSLLDGLRRRMDEQVAQTRTIAAQVGQLAESLGAMVDVQRKRSRWLNVNSFAAYVLFTLLCCGGFYALYSARARSLVDDAERTGRERDAAAHRADDASTKLAAREAADAKLLDAYRLLEAGKRTLAQQRIAELGKLQLSAFDRAVIEDRARAADAMQIEAAIKAAVAAFKANRAADAVTPLVDALAIAAQSPRVGELHYLLGLAKAKLNDLDAAAKELRAAIAAEVPEDDVHFQLATVLDRASKNADARAEYDRFASAHPSSPYAMFAMRRSASLARIPLPGAPLPKPAPAAAPAPAPVPAPAPAPPSDDKPAE